MTVSIDTTDPTGMRSNLARIFGKKLGPRIEGNADIAATKGVNQQLIVNRIQPLQYAAHQTHLAANACCWTVCDAKLLAGPARPPTAAEPWSRVQPTV